MLSQFCLLFSAVLIATQSWYAVGGSGGQDPQPQVALTPREHAPTKRTPAPNLRMDLKVVLVPVTVTDALDRPVNNLTQDRFRIMEDGVEQTITSFCQEESPVSLGLLFDSSGSMKNRIDGSVESLRQLFQTTIPGDEFFLVQFADEARLLGSFTTNSDDIFHRLGFVQAKGWTALLDSVALASHQMKAAKNPRKVLLILSDGGDNNSRFSEAEIRNMVLEGDLRVYAIALNYRPRMLQQLAQETGGNVLVAQSMSDLPDVVQRLSREIRSQYLLGYSAQNAQNDGKYHKVKVELVRPAGTPALRASWRHGYFAPAE
jgi:Ca-activated chloride channel homolog